VIIKQTYEGKTREFYAHKAILCAQSSFFMKAFTGNFKVSFGAKAHICMPEKVTGSECDRHGTSW
jgi:hypothetical protein